MILFLFRIFGSLTYLGASLLYVRDLLVLFALLFLYVLVHGFYAKGIQTQK